MQKGVTKAERSLKCEESGTGEIIVSRLERFSNFYAAFLASFKVAFTSTPSSKDHSLGGPEMKKPLSDCSSLHPIGEPL